MLCRVRGFAVWGGTRGAWLCGVGVKDLALWGWREGAWFCWVGSEGLGVVGWEVRGLGFFFGGGRGGGLDVLFVKKKIIFGCGARNVFFEVPTDF